MAPSSPSGGSTRLATTAGIACYTIWGLVPLLFQTIGRYGAGSWEILAHRTLWGAPTALIFVLLARQGRATLAALRQPRTLAWLALSSALIGGNWILYIWAVNSGHVLETSLGYYILPLLNMATGALFFHERFDRLGALAIGLAAVGVALQAAADGGLPVVSLLLALTFGGYGLVRKRVAAEAQTGLLIECALIAIPSLVYALWLQAHGAGHFGHGAAVTAWLVACGPITAVPLLLFAWATRRIPLSAMGFLLFITPTMSFVIGVTQGEPFGLLRGVSFGFIWAGVAAYGVDTWRKSRPAPTAAAASLAAE
jgi:chloramphenicol-sensitive protein RarD